MSEYYNPSDPNLVYIQSREATDPDLIDEYAEAMSNGAQFPAVKAIGEMYTVFIYDGYHRGQAAKKAGLPLLVSVKAGTRAEAEWLALTANQEHGLRRSNADKQKVVRLALLHEFGAKLSNRQLASHCGVSEFLVRKIREELEATAIISQSTERVGRDGRTIETANIGAKTLPQREEGDSPIGEKLGTPGVAGVAAASPKEKSVMCPNCDEVIFPEQDTKPNGAIVCDACKKRFGSYEALMKAVEKKIELLDARIQSVTRYCRFCDHSQEISGDDIYHESRVTCQRCYKGWPASGWAKEPKPKNGQQAIGNGQLSTEGEGPAKALESGGVKTSCGVCGWPGERKTTLTPTLSQGEREEEVEGEGEEPHSHDFDCPVCFEGRMVHVNGGAWCMACGVKWASVASFKLDLKSYEEQKAHQRNLEALVEAAGGPETAAQVLEMKEKEDLVNQVMKRVWQLCEEESVTGLKELLVVLEDFEMDRPM